MRTVTRGRDEEDTRRRQLTVLAELREVDHWRRLVAARLDLAVAAVADIDEPAVRSLPTAPAVPFGLRELLGLAAAPDAGHEVTLLVRLREVQRELDAYAAALRTSGLAEEPGTADAVLAPVVPLRRRGRHRGPSHAGPDGVA